MIKNIKISELMETCGVKFGTSGARGLVVDMTDEVCYSYTLGFIQYLEQIGSLTSSGERVVIAGDLVQARHDHRVDLARLAHATGHSLPEGEVQ